MASAHMTSDEYFARALELQFDSELPAPAAAPSELRAWVVRGDKVEAVTLRLVKATKERGDSPGAQKGNAGPVAATNSSGRLLPDPNQPRALGLGPYVPRLAEPTFTPSSLSFRPHAPARSPVLVQEETGEVSDESLARALQAHFDAEVAGANMPRSREQAWKVGDMFRALPLWHPSGARGHNQSKSKLAITKEPRLMITTVAEGNSSRSAHRPTTWGTGALLAAHKDWGPASRSEPVARSAVPEAQAPASPGGAKETPQMLPDTPALFLLSPSEAEQSLTEGSLLPDCQPGNDAAATALTRPLPSGGEGGGGKKRPSDVTEIDEVMEPTEMASSGHSPPVATQASDVNSLSIFTPSVPPVQNDLPSSIPSSGAPSLPMSVPAPLPAAAPSASNFLLLIEDEITGMQVLERNLRKLGLRQFQMASDGDCQFRALAVALHQGQEAHKKVRRDVVRHIRWNKKQYLPCFEDSAAFATYVQEMSKPGTWGNLLSLQAAADKFKLKIVLITSSLKMPTVELLPVTGSFRAEIRFSCYGGRQFCYLHR